MLNVLIVDDHPLLRAGLQCLLDATEDMRVVGATGSGLEAVALVARLHPDLVLMDVSMPGMDGVEVTRLVHRLAVPTAVVLLTSSYDAALIAKAFDAGAAGYLLKDMSPERLLRALRGLEEGRPPMDPRVARILARLAQRPEPSRTARKARSHETASWVGL